MIVPVLVERDLPNGMIPAKHIPTTSAMMPSVEESEGSLADRRVTDGGSSISFPKVARGWACDVGKICGQYILL